MKPRLLSVIAGLLIVFVTAASALAISFDTHKPLKEQASELIFNWGSGS